MVGNRLLAVWVGQETIENMPLLEIRKSTTTELHGRTRDFGRGRVCVVVPVQEGTHHRTRSLRP